MNAKKAFEKMFTLAGREVKSYRVDNGRFADKQWQEDCSLHNQKLTYCGVGNHAQNGKIEAKNKYREYVDGPITLAHMQNPQAPQQIS
jgi:hypothetical protein